MAGVLGFDDAMEVVRTRALDAGLRARAVRGQAPTEEVKLLDARGRVLAEAVSADRDQPAFDRATRDGFAVRAEGVTGEGVTGEAGFRVIGEVRAGERWGGPEIGAGEAVAIMTGAPMPWGADAVMMVEHVREADGWVRVEGGRTPRAGENVVPRGAEARAGEAVLAAGTPMDAAEVALAASCGRSMLPVYARPMVAIVATGDELVEVDAAPEEWQIRNSNSYGLAALVAGTGGWPGRLERARDLREEVWERVAQGRMWDLLLFSGGVSMGKYDLVEEVLAEFGAEFFFTGVKMQPGKPVVFGRLPAREGDGGGRECLFFGLPGNPVSTEVTFHCFVKPLLRVLAGAGWEEPRFVQATLAEDAAGKAGLMRLLPARLTYDRARPEVRLVGWKGSGDLHANARANCYAALPGDVEEFRAGDVISVLLR